MTSEKLRAFSFTFIILTLLSCTQAGISLPSEEDGLTLTSSSSLILAGETVTFTPSGGTGPFTFFTNNSTGTINSSTGVYTADIASSISTDTAYVVDSQNKAANKTISIRSVQSVASSSVFGIDIYPTKIKEDSLGNVWVIGYTNVGSYLAIFKSSDAGASFSRVDASSNILGIGRDITFDPASNNTVFVSYSSNVGLSGYLRKSIDGGVNWSNVDTYTVTADAIDDIQLAWLPSNQLVQLIYKYVLVGCTDTYQLDVRAGTSSFTPTLSNYPFPNPYGISVKQLSSGIAIMNGQITSNYWFSSDGISWVSVDFDAFSNIYDFVQLPNLNLVAISLTGMISSNDNGATWTVKNSIGFQSLDKISFNSSGDIFVLGGQLRKSADNGTSFYNIGSATNSSLYSYSVSPLAMTSQGKLFYFGSLGVFRSLQTIAP